MDDKEAREVLYRVDERTRNIEEKLDNIGDQTEKNRREIHNLWEKTNTNSQSINTAKAFLGLLGTAVSAVFLKIFEIITF